MKASYREFILYILVILAICLPWFFNSGYLFFTDFSIGPNISLDFLNNSFFTILLIKIFSLFYFYSFGQKIFLSFLLLIILLGGRKISENFTQSRAVIFLSSLFFLFNPFIYDRIMYGQVSIIGAFGFLCLSTGYLIQYIKKGELIQIYIAGLLAGLSIQMSLHFTFFFIVIYLLFITNLIINKFNFRKIIKVCIIVITIIIAINSNHLFNLTFRNSEVLNFTNNGIQQKDLEIFKTSGKTGFEATLNTLMMSGFWGKDQLRYIDLTSLKGNWGRSFLILIPIILWGIFIAIKNKELRVLSIGLIIIFLISSVLAIGIRIPISKGITYWLFNNFTLYRGFRETQKWVALIVIVYGVFLTIGLNKLFGKDIVKNNNLLALILIGGVIIMQSPFMLFGLRGQIKPVNFPNDWYQVNDYIINSQKINPSSNKECSDQILFLPWHMYMSFTWTGKVIFNPANSFFKCPVIQGTNMEWGGIYNNSLDKNSQKVEQWINEPHDIDLLNSNDLYIEYIILVKEVDWRKYEWLDTISELKLEKEFDSLKLYKVLHDK